MPSERDIIAHKRFLRETKGEFGLLYTFINLLNAKELQDLHAVRNIVSPGKAKTTSNTPINVIYNYNKEFFKVKKIQ